MTRLKRLLTCIVTALLVPAAVRAEPLKSWPVEAQTFADAPVSDALLASTVGTGPLPFTRGMHLISDADAVASLQQYGQTSRIAIDSWWAQTGAALIVNNILERRS